ncbi:hypothetical protein L6164_008605 [Bauhinia variegata]|uniref:Uncharacterized protein n=1 Tax=Bauhinia variegata TaxID=167791 RepID=A0ACB9PHA5_BAUVA|nr:hypothetical protein L6164_008605 [Bauhinia variegata]
MWLIFKEGYALVGSFRLCTTLLSGISCMCICLDRLLPLCGPYLDHMHRSNHGRPQSTRIRTEVDWRESSEMLRCSLCRFQGHNRTECPNWAS